MSDHEALRSIEEEIRDLDKRVLVLLQRAWPLRSALLDEIISQEREKRAKAPR